METCGYTSNIIFNGCTCQKGIYGYPHTQDFLHYQFPYVMVPSPDGLKSQVLLNLLARLNDEFNIVGLSLLEYTCSDKSDLAVLSEIIRIGTAL